MQGIGTRLAIAAVMVASCLAPAAFSGAVIVDTDEPEESLRRSQAPVLVIRSTTPQRNDNGDWELAGDVISDCVTDPAFRRCDSIELRLVYYYAYGSGTRRADIVVRVEPPHGECIPFTMRPSALSYTFVARQNVCGPVGCSTGRATTDPPSGGSSAVPNPFPRDPRSLPGATLLC